MLKIPFPFLLLHTSVLIEVDHTGRTLALRRGHHLLHDFLDRILPLEILNLTICRDYVYRSGESNYYVLHGDIFDTITTRFSWLAKIGDVGYSLLMGINRIYNRRRRKKDCPTSRFRNR